MLFVCFLPPKVIVRFILHFFTYSKHNYFQCEQQIQLPKVLWDLVFLCLATYDYVLVTGFKNYYGEMQCYCNGQHKSFQFGEWEF